jgi:hypothetical protein
MGRDGDLARGTLGRRESVAREPWVKGHREPDRRGSTRDRDRDRHRFTHGRECPLTRKGTSGRRERLIFTEGRRKRSWQTGTMALRESAEREPGSD